MKQKKPTRKTNGLITVEIPELKERVRTIAKREHISMSALARKAITAYLKDRRARPSI